MKSSENQIIFPTAYFPPISYFISLLKYDTVEFEIFETYPKQNIRNRCNILTANGLLNLTVPVNKPNGNKTTTGEILIFNEEHWQKKHFRAMESAYKSSPFYDYYIHQFEPIFSNRFEQLTDLNTQILKVILKILKIHLEFNVTKEYHHSEENIIDFRNTLDDRNSKLNPYNQVFSDRFPFQSDLSILDLIFNEGPNTMSYLKSNI